MLQGRLNGDSAAESCEEPSIIVERNGSKSPGLGWRPWKSLVLKPRGSTTECPLPAQDSLSIYHNAMSLKPQDVSLENYAIMGTVLNALSTLQVRSRLERHSNLSKD